MNKLVKITLLFCFIYSQLLFAQYDDIYLENIVKKNIMLRRIEVVNKRYNTEILRYKICWEFVSAGEAEMGITTTTLFGYKVYHIYTKTQSNKTVDLIYKVRNKTDSYVDYEGFYSLRFVKDQNEAGYVSKDDVYFDHKDNISYYLTDNTTGYIPTFVQDIVSSLYWLRLQDIELGKKFVFNVWVGKVVYPMIVDVLERKKIKIENKEYDCYKVEPKVDIQSFPLFRARGRLFVYITADEQKLPVRLESKVFIGRVFADLVEIK